MYSDVLGCPILALIVAHLSAMECLLLLASLKGKLAGSWSQIQKISLWIGHIGVSFTLLQLQVADKIQGGLAFN